MKYYYKYFLLNAVFVLPTHLAYSQYSVLSGTVKDKASGIPVEGASVFLLNDQKKVTFTDQNGHFKLNVSLDTLDLVCSMLGYKHQVQTIVLREKSILNFLLIPDTIQTDEVLIQSSNVMNDNLVVISMKDVKQLPSLIGEPDILRAAQLKPGIQNMYEGSSGIYVRGGGPDQSLYLLDGAPLFNPNHLFGFVSTFNGDAIKEMQLYKGNFPSRFGGRLSLVADVKTENGNLEKYHVFGGIGLIASRIGVEGPILKNKLSFKIAFRRSYYDLYTKRVNANNKGVKDYEQIPDHYFYDGNFILAFTPNKKNQFKFSSYLGNDNFKWNQTLFDFALNWGNLVSSLNWQHSFNSTLVLKSMIFYSRYSYKTTNRVDVYSQSLESGIENSGGQFVLEKNINQNTLFSVGIYGSSYNFNIGKLKTSKSDGTILKNRDNSMKSQDLGAFFELEKKLSFKTNVKIGSRLSSFITHNGKFYYGSEPRLSVFHKLDNNFSISLSYALMNQYVNMISNSGASLPTDVWYPVSKNVVPQRAQQIALSFKRTTANGNFEVSNESYYKWCKNQIDLKDGGSIYDSENLESNLAFGKAWNYGNEFLIEKKKGKTKGWIGYTISWSQRQFEKINKGEKYFSRYDRRHDFSSVLIQTISKRFSTSLSWIYSSGNAVTLPVARYFLQDVPGTDYNLNVPVFEKRNSFRMPPSHRLDISVSCNFFPKIGESVWTLSIYNAYNRQNPYFIYYDTVRDSGGNIVRFEALQVSLMPLIPSLTYNFKY